MLGPTLIFRNESSTLAFGSGHYCQAVSYPVFCIVSSDIVTEFHRVS